MRIVGLCGSLRRDSLNHKLLLAAAACLEAPVEFEIADIGGLPLYNGDVEAAGLPDSVQRLKAAIASADGLLFATPEFNHGIPGVLKNAIDWASRPAFKSPLAHKPCGLLTAAPGDVGGARAQADLQRALASTRSPVFPAIELLVPRAGEVFGARGELTDATVQRRLTRYVHGFQDWLRSQGGSGDEQ